MSVAAATTTMVPKREHVETASKADRRQVRTAFAFLAPSLLGVILFLVIPIILVIFLSLVQWNLLTPMKWVGLSNYVNIFKYDGFGHSLAVTAYYVILNIPIQTAFALGMAMLLRGFQCSCCFLQQAAQSHFHIQGDCEIDPTSL